MRTSPYITENERTPPLRGCLSDDDRRTLPPCLHTQHYRRGAYLFLAGEVADQFFWVCQGIVKLSALTLEGGERLLNIFWPGDFFGTLWLSHDQRRVSSAQAVSPVTVQAATNGELAQFLQRCPEIHTDLLQNLFEQQGRITLRIGALLNADIGERLLVVLLDLAERYGRPIPNGYQLAADLTQEDIAQLVGLDRSTTSLLINRYRRGGVLGGRGRLLEIYQAPVRALLKRSCLAMLE